MRSKLRRQVGDNDNSHVVVANVALRASRDYRDAFIQAMDEFRTHYPEEELVKLIRDQGVDATDGVDFNELLALFAGMAFIHARAANAAGAATAIGISEETGVEFLFSMTPEMQDRLQATISTDIRFLVDSTDRGARVLVELMLEEGMSPEEAARWLHRTMGVDQNRARRWRKFQRQIGDAGLISEVEVDEKIEDFSDALVRDRGKSAGGDEAWSGTQQGRLFGLEAATAAGILTAFSVKVWHTMEDELVCPRCGPMHMQAVPVGMSFQSPYDGTMVSRPQLHPKCRCWLRWRLA